AYDAEASLTLAQTLDPLFTSSTGRFAIAFPDEPEISRETDEIGGDPIEIHEFLSGSSENSYMVAYADLPAAFLSQGTEDVLNQVRDLVMESLDWEGLTELEMETSMDGHPGRSYRYSGDDFTLDMRLYLVGERMYLLTGIDVDETAVNQFMGSFELL
ncbi:MAG: hypothetical protein F6K42_28760, partial [Leptolyngbya sp. SIO1D8]|nr:hypothetical protein [Leptolyngbya sp. SIO1D8]